MTTNDDFLKYASEKQFPIRISLPPAKLDSNYKQHILSIITSQYNKVCIPEHGYIINVVDIMNIVSQNICSLVPNASLCVNVRMLSFFPKVGMTFKIMVDIIFSHGIFTQMNKIRIIIPIVSMTGWSLQKDFTGQRLYHESLPSIQKGSIIDITLTEIRFENDGFSCIGALPVVTPKSETHKTETQGLNS